jgi:hypothetical protein
MGLPITVMTAHPVDQAAGSALGAADSAQGATGWHWLHRAAEMAALATGRAPVPVGALPESSSSAAPLAPDTDVPEWTCFPRIAMRTPGSEPGSITAARKFTTLTMQRWGIADLEADVAVVVSELLTNAVRHGLLLAGDLPDRPIRLGLLHSGPSLMCAVADPSDQMPVAREPRWLEESGRGLHVIASLSDRWGSCAAPGQAGKVVWATFTTAR